MEEQSQSSEVPVENAEDQVAEEKQGDHPNTGIIALLSYIGILFLVPLLAAKESEFAQYHAKQGAVLFIAEVATVFIMWIPILGWIVGFVASIAWLILSVIGIIHVIDGEKKPLPFIGQYADRL